MRDADTENPRTGPLPPPNDNQFQRLPAQNRVYYYAQHARKELNA
jgi:hypothetical protein